MTQDFRTEAMRLLEYSPETGEFFWREPQGRQPAGARAGSIKDGYVQISVCNRDVRAHRLAWLFQTGSWPPKGYTVDHENRDRADNRWTNLRLATADQQSANGSLRRTNTSGHPGVYLHKATGLWQPLVFRKGKAISLGYYRTKEEAIAVRREAAKRHYGEFASDRQTEPTR